MGRTVAALWGSCALACVPIVAEAQLPPAQVVPGTSPVGWDTAAGKPCYVGASATCTTAPGSNPSAAVGNAAATTRSPSSYKDTATGNEDPAIGTSAGGQQVQSWSPNFWAWGAYGGAGATVASAANSPAVGPLYAERSWIARCAGTLGSGDALQLQGLAADGATWVNVGSSQGSLPFSFAFVPASVPTGSAANYRFAMTGSNSSTLWCALD